MSKGKEPVFVVGGRYANRKGEYEVLALRGENMLIRYDDGTEQEVSLELQSRIASNMAIEASIIAPYDIAQKQRNDLFFFTLGFLTNRATMLEAIIPPHALAGFVQDYLRLKGAKPREGQVGFYVHQLGVDKWGCELRTTFRADCRELANLEFGPNVNIVKDPANPDVGWRINNNGFWWKLLKLGFEMGTSQDANRVRKNVPFQYREQFNKGYNAAS